MRGVLKGQLDLFHDSVGFAQDFDDLLIVAHVIEGQRPALTVLQPFLRGLIAADVEFPRDGRRYSGKKPSSKTIGRSLSDNAA